MANDNGTTIDEIKLAIEDLDALLEEHEATKARIAEAPKSTPMPATKAEVLTQSREEANTNPTSQPDENRNWGKPVITAAVILWAILGLVVVNNLDGHDEPTTPTAPVQQPVSGEPFPGYQPSPFAKEIGK